jgi:hypothetical protein
MMGKAKHPYDTARPAPAGVRHAIENDDMEALRHALTVRRTGTIACSKS